MKIGINAAGVVARGTSLRGIVAHAAAAVNRTASLRIGCLRWRSLMRSRRLPPYGNGDVNH